MSFSPFGTMITVCVCFNSRVPLTVPSFTAWPRSRYSKTLFIVFRWPAQEKDKSVSVRDATLLKRGRLAGFLHSLRLQPRAWPPQVASPSVLQAGPLGPHLTPFPGSSGYQKLHRSPDQMDRVAILCGQGFDLLTRKMEVLIPPSQDPCDAWDMRGVDTCPLWWLRVTPGPTTAHTAEAERKGAPLKTCPLESVPCVKISPISTFCPRSFCFPSGWNFACPLPSH